MNDLGSSIKHPKLRGEWAELRFMAAAAEHGLCITKPWGESAPYDFLSGHAAHIVRIQVKSTICKIQGGYTVTVHRSNQRRYPAGVFDFLAAYLILEDLWYIVPEWEIRGQHSLTILCRSKKSRFAAYREAWDLLRGTETADPLLAPVPAGVECPAELAVAPAALMRLLRCSTCESWGKCYERHKGAVEKKEPES